MTNVDRIKFDTRGPNEDTAKEKTEGEAMAKRTIGQLGGPAERGQE
jgi:hypothetical protein